MGAKRVDVGGRTEQAIGPLAKTILDVLETAPTGANKRGAATTPEYRAGLNDAKQQLIKWRDNKNISPSQMADEWSKAVSTTAGQRRQGMTDAFAAYLWGMMHLGEPVLELWEPLEDLQAESFHLEEA
jgi:hypothetical protein